MDAREWHHNVSEGRRCVFRRDSVCEKKILKMAISDTLGLTNAMVRAQRKDFGEEKGSTSHPSGKQWLTV